jgi:hypothetical protein
MRILVTGITGRVVRDSIADIESFRPGSSRDKKQVRRYRRRLNKTLDRNSARPPLPGRVKTPTTAARVETFCRNCAP